ncbi:hypothetical protein Tco_1057047 [Tanacetum coccineum]|uniref:Uncharacterized protein n=1 Tax=Tanacetum coccineum TaxID=301880 RepID=A0ABQ5H4Z9_9ASTR
MKAQDQDHINDTERMLSVVLSMNEQSQYKQEKTRTRPMKAKLKSQIKITSIKNVNVREIIEDLNIGGDSLERERDFLLTKFEEVLVLSSKLEATSLEKAKFVKDFLPSDYHPEAEKLFDEAAAAFYKLEFLYISLLSGKASQSLEELSIIEAPSIQPLMTASIPYVRLKGDSLLLLFGFVLWAHRTYFYTVSLKVHISIPCNFLVQLILLFSRPGDQPIDVGSPSVEPLRSIADNEQVESSSLSKDKGVFGFKLVVVKEDNLVTMMPKKKKPKAPRRISMRGSVPPPPATVPKGTGKHPRVLARFVRSLANNAKEAHVAHNMIFGLHCPLLKDKLVVGNMLTNESRVLSQGHVMLKNDLVSLKSKKSFIEHGMSKLEDRLEKA